MRKWILLLVIACVVWLSTGCASILERYNSPVDPTDTSQILVTVPKGASTTAIANLLKEDDLIQNVNAFKAKVKVLEMDGKMQAGDYQLTRAMSAEEIINKLVAGDVYVETEKFTIPEGYEVRQIIETLSDAGLIDPDVFRDVLQNTAFDYKFLENVDRSYLLEGYLFPDTYIIKTGTSEEDIVRMMLNRFDEVFNETYYERAKELGLSVDQVIALASIIERETKREDELAKVSSVFHNRLKINMMLQSCATIQYVLQERKDRLTYDDLEIVSPFNTYQHLGLPPAPIASPGAKAIEAALYPADTDYLYFVTTNLGDGSHYFNTTLEGHNRDTLKGKANGS